MKFKEFSKWCNERACDGCWGMAEAIVCCETAQTIYKLPFWKREKAWKEIYKDNYDPDLFDSKNIGNTCVGLTYKETKLFLKKMKKKGWY